MKASAQNGILTVQLRSPALKKIGPAAADAVPALTKSLHDLSGKRALWVDDEPQNNTHDINALQAQGIDVIMCKTTQEALEQVHMGTFDVIITDQLRYEDGVRNDMAGYDLIGRLRQDGVKVSVTLSTAYPNRDDQRSITLLKAFLLNLKLKPAERQ